MIDPEQISAIIADPNYTTEQRTQKIVELVNELLDKQYDQGFIDGHQSANEGDYNDAEYDNEDKS